MNKVYFNNLIKLLCVGSHLILNLTKQSLYCFITGRRYIPQVNKHSLFRSLCMLMSYYNFYVKNRNITCTLLQDNKKFLRFQLNISFDRTIYFVYTLILYKNANLGTFGVSTKFSFQFHFFSYRLFIYFINFEETTGIQSYIKANLLSVNQFYFVA